VVSGPARRRRRRVTAGCPRAGPVGSPFVWRSVGLGRREGRCPRRAGAGVGRCSQYPGVQRSLGRTVSVRSGSSGASRSRLPVDPLTPAPLLGGARHARRSVARPVPCSGPVAVEVRSLPACMCFCGQRAGCPPFGGSALQGAPAAGVLGLGSASQMLRGGGLVIPAPCGRRLELPPAGCPGGWSAPRRRGSSGVVPEIRGGCGAGRRGRRGSRVLPIGIAPRGPRAGACGAAGWVGVGAGISA